MVQSDWRRAAIYATAAAVAVAVLYFLHLISHVLLIFFAGCLLALLLDGGARFIEKPSGLRRSWSLALFSLLLLLVLIAVGWFTGDRIAGQIDELGRRLPQAWEDFRERIMQFSWVQSITDDMPKDAKAMDEGMVERLARAMRMIFGGVATIIVIIFAGVYLAARPESYVKVLTRVLPPPRRERAREVFAALSHALKRWLVGRLLSMLVIGVLTGLVLWWLGLPLALPLGLIAGLLSFIPYLGPILAALPGILIAFPEGHQMVAWVALAYGGVQLVESYLITPLIERRAVHIPPAFQITAQLIGGVTAGLMGVLLASPVLVTATVLVQMLWVEDHLAESPSIIGNGDD